MTSEKAQTNEDLIAGALLNHRSSGLCSLRKVCNPCDCGDPTHSDQRAAARAILAAIEETGRKIV